MFGVFAAIFEEFELTSEAEFDGGVSRFATLELCTGCGMFMDRGGILGAA